MARIVVSEFVSLDGVIEDPAGDEGFERGGWVGRVKADDRIKLEEASAAEALLLGRRSYAFFATRWPSRSGVLADRLNALPKYVVSSTLDDLAWAPATVIGVDDVAALKAELRGDIVVYASSELVRELLCRDLVDELRLMVVPVVLGSGRRLFDGADMVRLQSVDARRLGDAVLLTYAT